MLELRPSCEHCDRDLPPASRQAMICSFECTFCSDCVATILDNVCPNCGGGFQPRPVRPSRPHKPPAWLGERPAGTKRIHRPLDRDDFERFRATLRSLDPYAR